MHNLYYDCWVIIFIIIHLTKSVLPTCIYLDTAMLFCCFVNLSILGTLFPEILLTRKG